jgi:hypothetical protein
MLSNFFPWHWISFVIFVWFWYFTQWFKSYQIPKPQPERVSPFLFAGCISLALVDCNYNN